MEEERKGESKKETRVSLVVVVVVVLEGLEEEIF
jgi:hypothetical protein